VIHPDRRWFSGKNKLYYTERVPIRVAEVMGRKTGPTVLQFKLSEVFPSFNYDFLSSKRICVMEAGVDGATEVPWCLREGDYYTGVTSNDLLLIKVNLMAKTEKTYYVYLRDRLRPAKRPTLKMKTSLELREKGNYPYRLDIDIEPAEKEFEAVCKWTGNGLDVKIFARTGTTPNAVVIAPDQKERVILPLIRDAVNKTCWRLPPDFDFIKVAKALPKGVWKLKVFCKNKNIGDRCQLTLSFSFETVSSSITVLNYDKEKSIIAGDFISLQWETGELLEISAGANGVFTIRTNLDGTKLFWNLINDFITCSIVTKKTVDTAASGNIVVNYPETQFLVINLGYKQQDKKNTVDLYKKHSSNLKKSHRRNKTFFNNLKIPEILDQSEKYIYSKAASILKLNVESAQGKCKYRWTTPDKYPHRQMWIWDSVFHAIGGNILIKRWLLMRLLLSWGESVMMVLFQYQWIQSELD
ncbi:MAG: hypothetical protein KAS17_06905, partial [Victivallaceae bacterium]|nr:hypothetical protein [Victivallaceae bacterium]